MLINCIAYDQGHKLVDLAGSSEQDLLQHLDQPQRFVWVALREPDAEELARCQRVFGLHALAIEDTQRGGQRPKLEEYGDGLFVVMHLLDWVQGQLSVGQIAVFVGKDHILSARSGSRLHFLGVRERCEQEPDLLALGPSYVLYALMDAVVDRYFPLLERLETELDQIEQSIFLPGAAQDNVQRLYTLKRHVMQMRHSVAPLLEVVGKLHGGRTPPLCHATTDYFRDVGDHLSRILAAIDTVRDTIITAIQANLSMVAIEDSNITKRLAAWASLFAAATALAGIWGMNFEHMPELHWTWGYPMALGLMATVCTTLWWRFKRMGWL